MPTSSSISQNRLPQCHCLQRDFCQQLFEGKPFDHAHNIYLQAWANAGILGAVGIFILGFLLWKSWSRVDLNDPGNALIINIGITTSAYIFFLGFLDASLIHWPTLLVISGLFLATPFALNPAQTDIDVLKI
jgi:O-antigen ligase